ncbi:MAG TPA: response regulator [Aggregatilineaceae bacterium]|nr:response regulator [Aggregatilineaceae bacterium]
MNIIYVEDDPTNILLLERVTSSTGDALMTFNDAESALRSEDIWNADLFLVDIHLPGKLNGLDMTELLRKHGVDVPIVMITAYDLPDYIARCRAIGGDMYLVKPVSVPELVEVLNDYRGE